MGVLHDNLANDGHLCLTPGDYDIGDQPLILKGKQYIVGDSMDGVRIFYSGTGAAIQCNPDGAFTRGRLARFTVWGNPGCEGISIGQLGAGTKSAQMFLEQVRTTRCGVGIVNYSAQLCSYRDVWADLNDTGVAFRAAQRSTANRIEGLHCNLNSSHGMEVESLECTTFTACQFEDNGGAGVKFGNGFLDTTSIVFTGSWFEGNMLADIDTVECTKNLCVKLLGNQHAAKSDAHLARRAYHALLEEGCFYRSGRNETVVGS